MINLSDKHQIILNIIMIKDNPYGHSKECLNTGKITPNRFLIQNRNKTKNCVKY